MRCRSRIEKSTLFNSTLSINEFVLSAAFRIQGVVSGSIVYTEEDEDFPAASQTMKAAARRQSRIMATAIARIHENASRLEATGVIGVQIQHRSLEKNLWEYTLTGTAIADHTLENTDQPFICTLSAQEYKILQAGGFRPVGLAYGISIYAQRLHQRVQQKVQQKINTERSDFTRGLYAARKYAFAALDQEAIKLKSEGILGINITMERTLHREAGINQGMRIKLVALGTAVASCLPDNPAGDLIIAPVVLTSA